MAILAYSVRDQSGKLIRGFSEAKTKEELVRLLQSKGLTVISIEERKGVVSLQQTKGRVHRSVKIDDLTLFARQMAVLLESGVTILRAINVLMQQIESTVLLETCKNIEEDLKRGISL
ncbi:MAG: hypothetical protein NC828_06460, partial [Candidatus Omnitrophica bacterium]|nr:hypothetical protein [Candidatus Omnitrophota bacterium]